MANKSSGKVSSDSTSGYVKMVLKTVLLRWHLDGFALIWPILPLGPTHSVVDPKDAKWFRGGFLREDLGQKAVRQVGWLPLKLG